MAAKRNAQVLFDFTATREGHLTVAAGEILATGKTAPGGWVLATNIHAKSGYVPEKFIRFLDDDEPAAAAPTPEPVVVTQPTIVSTPPPTLSTPPTTLTPPASLSLPSTAPAAIVSTPAAVVSPPPPLIVQTSSPTASSSDPTGPWNSQLIEYMHQVRLSSAQLWLHHENLSKLIAEAKVITQLLRDSLRIPNLRHLEKNTTSSIAAIAPELMRSVSALAKGSPDAREGVRASINMLNQRIQVFFELAEAASNNDQTSQPQQPVVQQQEAPKHSEPEPEQSQEHHQQHAAEAPEPVELQSSSGLTKSGKTRSQRSIGRKEGSERRSKKKSQRKSAEQLPPPPEHSYPLPSTTQASNEPVQVEEAVSRSVVVAQSTSSSSSSSTGSSSGADDIAQLQAIIADLRAQASRQAEKLVEAERRAEESVGDVHVLMGQVEELKTELKGFHSAATTYTETQDRSKQEFKLIEKQIYHSHIEFDAAGRLTAAEAIIQQLDAWSCWDNKRREDARLLHRIRSSVRAIADKFQHHSRVIGHFLSFTCSLLDLLQSHHLHQPLLSGSSIRNDGILSAAVHEYTASGLLGTIDDSSAASSESGSSVDLPGFEPVVRTFEMNVEQLTFQLFKALLSVYSKQLGPLALRAMLCTNGIGSTILFRELDRIYGELLENRIFEKVAEHLLVALVYFLNATWFNAFMTEPASSTLFQSSVARTLKSLDAELNVWIGRHAAAIPSELIARSLRESSAAAEILLAAEVFSQSGGLADVNDDAFRFGTRFAFLSKWQIHQLVKNIASGESGSALRESCALTAEEANRATGVMISEELNFHLLMTEQQIARGRSLPSHALRIVDAYGNNRAVISQDGTIRDQQSYPLGVVVEDGNTLKVFSFDASPVGSIDAGGIAADADGECVGFVEVLQAGVIKNAEGSILAEIDTIGQIKGNANTFCGEVRNFTLHLTNHFAAFSLFFDEDNMCAFGSG